VVQKVIIELSTVSDLSPKYEYLTHGEKMFNLWNLFCDICRKAHIWCWDDDDDDDDDTICTECHKE
jgi:hypothetical protein